LIADARTGPTAVSPSCIAVAPLGRRIVIDVDEPWIADYLRSVYRRVVAPLPSNDDKDVDRGQILAHNGAHWLLFNGEPLSDVGERPSTNFRLAFYGSSKLLRASFRRNEAWNSLYGAALRIGDRAVVISAQSGIGKTTLSLELMARGAGFLSDEFVFIRKHDRMVAGLIRGMLIRERSLAVCGDPRLQAICARLVPRVPHGDRVWDDVDPGDVFGEQVLAQPAKLAALIMLERQGSEVTATAQVPSALAAVDLCKRVNSGGPAFDRLADAALMLSGIPCYRLSASSPKAAADAIEALLA